MNLARLDSLATYARVLDALPIVSWISEIDGTLVYVSPRWESLTGNPATQSYGAAYGSFIHPDDAPSALAAWEAARERLTPYRAEVRVLCGDGSYRWMLSEANPIRHEGGDVIGWLGTVADVHDRRVALDLLARRNELLQAAEERHRLTTEALPGTSWTAKPDGSLDLVVDGGYALPRRPTAARLGTDWLDGVHDDDREFARERWQHSIESGDPYEATFRVRIADGSHRWHLVRALPQRDPTGESIVRWVGLGIDIDDRVRADGEREKFVALAERSGDFIGIADVSGRIVYVNPAALELLETTAGELEGKSFFTCFHSDDVPFVTDVVLPAIERDGHWLGEYRLRNFRTGRAMPVTANAFAIGDAAGNRTGFATIGRDRREQQRFDIGMRALAEAGKAMHDSLDFAATLQNIADAIVAGFAHHCSVEIIERDGMIRSVTCAARDPAELPIARAAVAARNAALPEEHPIRRAIARGESTLNIGLNQQLLHRSGLDRFVGSRPGMLDFSSVIYVPVRSPHDGRVYGSLSCGLAVNDDRIVYTQDDLRFAEELGVRAGLAFDNARAYERTRRVAVEMQAASLPERLPRTNDLELSAEYRPAADEATIGGDWYDAFVLADGRVVMTLGDVAGHGLEAAIWMTKLRQSLQAAAMLDADPRVMLGVADRTLGMLDGDVYATALVALYDGRTRRLTVASAGHPSPYVARADGSVEEISCTGNMFGIPVPPAYEARTIDLRAGDLVVFYTDGLVEAERDFDLGGRRLRDALARPDVRTAANPALAIFERVLAGATIQDDVAILTARAR